MFVNRTLKKPKNILIFFNFENRCVKFCEYGESVYILKLRFEFIYTSLLAVVLEA